MINSQTGYEQTIYAWRKHVAQLEPVDLKRLKVLSIANSKLEKLSHEGDLESDAMMEIN